MSESLHWKKKPNNIHLQLSVHTPVSCQAYGMVWDSCRLTDANKIYSLTNTSKFCQVNRLPKYKEFRFTLSPKLFYEDAAIYSCRTCCVEE